MKNFLFTGANSINDSNSFTNNGFQKYATSYTSLTENDLFKLSSIYNNTSATTGKVQLKLFDNSVNGDLKKWYADGYYLTIGAFQLTTATSNNLLPYIFIREEPGIHIIGLDCAGYLSAVNSASDTL
jgi:hypothetical protein